MKKIISATLICATTSLVAMQAEEAYLYKDARIMGMGGTNIAVGGYSTSLFSNPAGIARIKKEDGFVVEVLGLGLDATAQVTDFADDMSNAIDTEQIEDLTAVLEKYNGEHFHQGFSNYSSLSKNSDLFAWSVGLLVAEDANFMTHVSGCEIGLECIETTSRGYGGLMFAGAKTFDTTVGQVDVGVGFKYVAQVSYEGLVSAIDLVDDNISSDELRNQYEQQSSGFGIDLGVNYHPVGNSYGHPVVALSVMNIGTINMDDNYGGQPMTVNLGFAVTPEVQYIEKLTLAVDYVDIFGANKQREYTSETDYIDHNTYDFIKKLRLGVGVCLVENQWVYTQLNFGLYQGGLTAGFDLLASVIKINLATYEEQVGTGSVDISDRRYMAQFGVAW